MQIRTIPMEQWCALARENVAPPVTICLEGESMRPLIRKGRDPVTIVPVRGELKKGDVVLIIESMKLMNEVLCEQEGTVAEILVQNGDAVEFDQPILRIE